MGDVSFIAQTAIISRMEILMKKYQILLAIVVLVLASLACQALSGGGNAPNSAPKPSDGDQPSSSDVDSADKNDTDTGNDSSSETDFPMTKDAFNVIEIGDGTLLYYTKMSGEDVMDFYRDVYTSRGYTERELLTVVSDGVFSMVFDSGAGGKAVVIQSVDLGDGSRTVTIRLEDV